MSESLSAVAAASEAVDAVANAPETISKLFELLKLTSLYQMSSHHFQKSILYSPFTQTQQKSKKWRGNLSILFFPHFKAN